MKVSTKKTPVKNPAIALLLMSLVVGCGTSADQFLVGSEEQNATAADVIQSDNLVKVPLEIQNGDLNLTAAVSASDYRVNVVACASGFTITDYDKGDGGSDELEVYKGDRDCRFELEYIVFDGVTYNYVSGNFTDGAISTFSDGSQDILLEMVANFPSVITGTEALSASFYALDQKEVENVAESSVSDAHAITIEGVEAPNLDMLDPGPAVTLASIDGSGVGTFALSFECGAAISGNVCDEYDMNYMAVALVDATAAVHFADSSDITYAEADALASGLFTAVSSIRAAGGADNGGIDISLAGHGQLESSRNMVAIIAYDVSEDGDPTVRGAGSSYLAIEITIPGITQ